jgi:thioester reductase-like protein
MEPTEGIAIVGLGCRLPGANSPEAFWELLINGKDAMREIPGDRWDINKFYDPEPGKPGKISTRWGGFLDQVDGFDADFFGISPREAERMDPQQRLVLEVAWEALEQAGIVPEQLAGSQTGVFLGVGNYDYCRILAQDIDRASAYDGTGNSLAIHANRISYILNLRGPSLIIDTACSSSLVALHYACQSLRNGETDLCLTGGVSLMLSPEPFMTYSQARMMAADGRCKTFDARADGYVRGEGCGIVVLKRWADARLDGDRILAVVRGTAVNQDGLSNGLTAPNGPSQQWVIRRALHHSGIEPADISYIEAHGTGTPLGDPIEYKSLKAVLMQNRTAEQPCWLGSAKTNIGHLESAAGIAGLIKVVLSMQHQIIPPHLHLQELNPYISLEGTTFAIPSQPQPWTPGSRTRLAGISGFGFGGTNAHVILEESIAEEKVNDPTLPIHLLTLSAKSETALQELAQKYENYLKETNADLAEICGTANTKRSIFPHRLAIMAHSLSELQEKLTAPYSIITNQKRPKVVFLFTGQGSQYIGMGNELYNTNSVFRETIDRCDKILKKYLDHSLKSILYGNQASLIDQTAYTQPIMFALEYALFRVWQSWGIKPTIVMGHSVGEYVAACVAGVFSLEDALKLIAARGRLMQALPDGGAMVAVFASEAIVAAAIQGYEQVAIAAINGTQNTVISGQGEAIAEIITSLKSQGIKSKPLTVSHAFHSPLMEPMQEAFMTIARQITYASPQIKLISNLTGALATEAIATPDYWCQHIRQPVQFAASMEVLSEYSVFLEIGAKPTLLGMGRYCLPDTNAAWLPSLYPGRSDWRTLFQSLGELYMRGVAIDWEAIYPGNYRASLPTYPFQRQRYWAEVKDSTKVQISPLLKLLSQGKTEELIGQLKASESFSTAELELLPRLLEAMTQKDPQEFQDWLYEIQWVERSRQSCEPDRTETWLILADRIGVAESLAEQLRDRHQTCFLLYPDQPDFDFTQPIHHIVHLWSLDLSFSELTLHQLEQSQTLGVNSILNLINNVLHSGHNPKFWLVTQNAISINNSAVNPSQTPLWGLGKVMAIEHPELWGGMIDFSKSNVDQLRSELIDSQGEDHLALHQGKRFAGRLMPRSLPPSKKITLDGSYLITGGLGALGLQVARSLIQQGANQLVLVSRRPPSAIAQQQIDKLNANITIAQADVADEAEMARLINAIPTLRGVIHAAGSTNFKVLRDLTPDAMNAVLRPKVLGGWVLHRLTRSLDLDFFINFSSITSIFGSKGQAHYAAANHFLDGLAHYRRSIGLPALSINWSFWDGAGMASEELQTAALKQLGLEALPPQTAIAAFNHLLGGDCAQITVANVNWTKFKEVFELQGKRSLLEKLGQTTAIAKSELLQNIEAAASPDRYSLLLTALRTEVAQVLKLPELPDPQRGLFELGMDSLMAVVLVNSIRTQLQTDLPITDLMEASSIEAIAQILSRSFVNDSIPNVISNVTTNVLDLNAEAVLEASITPISEVSPDINAILLTGATGYLGAFLLREILAHTEADIYCLVRANNISAGMQRIQQNLESYGLWEESLSARIIPICGDLAKPFLGLSPDQFDRLAHQIDRVYHNGAVLNFVYPYAALKAANVLGTQEILRFACQSKTKPLHYISTDGVFDSSDWYGQEVTEDIDPIHTAGIELGYTQTKWVAEKLVVQARDRGLPVSIYRPPLIAGDSRTGTWFTDDFICRFIKGCIQLGTMPIMSNRLTMSPVDYVSRAIVYLSLQPSSLGQAFHLNNPDPSSWTEFVGSINALGYPVATVSFEVWIQQLGEAVARSPDNALSELLPFFMRRWSDEKLTFAELGQRRVQLNCQNTIQQLKGSYISCARVDSQLLSTYFSYFVKSGFLSVPKVIV